MKHSLGFQALVNRLDNPDSDIDGKIIVIMIFFSSIIEQPYRRPDTQMLATSAELATRSRLSYVSP